MRWQMMFTLLLVGVLSGCAHTENIQVSAIAAGDDSTQYKKFAIVSDKYQATNDDLQFAEYARQVTAVLNQQGYVQAQNSKDAQILVSLSYRLSAPQTRTDIVNVPVYPNVGPFYDTRFGHHPYPILGYPVYQPMVYQSIIYKKLVRLQAIDAVVYAKDKTVKPLWDVMIISHNDNDDLRYMFPYMLVAAEPYIGRNSAHSIEVSVPEKDPAVMQLRGM
ncbi:DUF4136 domain-containing protein [Pragia fontium]|uniref:DUF4136 domain-containing protein n=1 Tax=Pragia fontium DSM 5563 = ATCC 49100 TaxID=1122977 RepID=A0AAJ4W9S2_9GAMM|nr:DUF4136 domain-containing protein [Pragia fontium]SFC62003.1 protein of unknown function [Pragia fontium DSM 5563 = ATCC 49100]SUB83675.1 Uncharacterised protein [Pragia fontium]VEJ56580.1 Uncharacterised protein [Pragia fontium]